MELQICQDCGIIIRGKSKSCSGCGATISKFSPTSLPAMAKSFKPLAAELSPDPLALERAVNRVQYVSVGVRSSINEDGTDFSDAPDSGGYSSDLGQGNGSGAEALSAPVRDIDSQFVPPPEDFEPSGPGFEGESLSSDSYSPALSQNLSSDPSDFSGSEPQADANPQTGAIEPIASTLESLLSAPDRSNSAEFDADNPRATQRELSESKQFLTASETQPASLPPAAATDEVSAPASSASFVPVAASVTAASSPESSDLLPPIPAASPGAMAMENSFSQAKAPSPSSTPGAAASPPAPTPAPAPVTTVAFNPSGASSAPFNPAAAGGLDFFAPKSSEAVSEPSPVQLAVLQKTEEPIDVDIPEGTPEIVAQAMRAAARQKAEDSAASIEAAGTATQAEAVKPKGDDERAAKSAKSKAASDSDKAETPAKRRSFSGSGASSNEKSSSPSNKRSQSRKRFKDDDDDDDDDKDAEKKSDASLKIGGFEVSTKQLSTYAIMGGGGLALIIVVLMVVGSLFSGSKTPPSGSASVAGTWQIGAVNTNGTKFTANAFLDQSGNSFKGNGVDQFGNFAIVGGVYNAPKIQFQKIYIDSNNQPLAKPIQYQGVIDWVNPDPTKPPFIMHMYGQWACTRGEGQSWRRRIVTRTGKWEGAMMERRMATNADGSANPAGFNNNASNPIGDLLYFVFAFPKEGDPQGPAKFGMRMVVFILILAAGAVFLSSKLFGPGGLLNIWSKKEYIPSQFKSQWNKTLREFGKPLRPGGLPLGNRADWNILSLHMPRKLNMPPELRVANPHMLVLGGGGKGKSRLLAGMIAHDIESNDRAVVVIDSDGSLIDHLMTWIAAHKKGSEFARRLIVVDPTHGSETMAYNPLEFPDDGDLQSAASAVVFGFKAIYTEPPGSQSQWNQQTANILRNSAILLMANGCTLTDLPKLLSENDFRDVLLERIERMKSEKTEYSTLLEAWAQYKRLARTDQWINWVEPILNRVQPMLGDPRIRPILTKIKGDLNLKEIVSEGKILFVKVPQGQLDSNASLLGSLIVTGLKQAALSLSLKSKSRRHQCALYLDELENFVEKETFDALTSETKKFQIGFVGAAKSLQDLPEDYRNKIVSGVGTMCCFSLVKKDGDMLGPQMFRVDGRKVKHQTLQNIFNKVNTAPQFELITDEEKLNIDRVVGQEDRTYFCYRVGTIAGVFQMKSPDFDDIPDKDVNWTLVDKIYARSVPSD